MRVHVEVGRWVLSCSIGRATDPEPDQIIVDHPAPLVEYTAPLGFHLPGATMDDPPDDD